MLQDPPKRIKRALRQLMEMAYERELHQELEKLDQGFAAWREGTINSFELNQLTLGLRDVGNNQEQVS
ncbi:MAG TPA: hypothetical protein VLA19_19380 [Herpetosiphonaceae bacterium]|nr:hypothetical protein [Herpetosiphonaceae bacterium]